MKQPDDLWVISVIDNIEKVRLKVPIKERLSDKALVAVIMKFDSDNNLEYEEIVNHFKESVP